MALSFNGTTLATNIDAVVFNGTAVSKVMFNGTEVWAKAADITFTTARNPTSCNAFSASSNTFTIGGGAIIAYSKSTGFTGNTGSLGSNCGSTLSTASGRIQMTGSSGYVDIEYISNIPYFRGSSNISSGGCIKGLSTAKNTSPTNRVSLLYGSYICGEEFLYATNDVMIKY